MTASPPFFVIGSGRCGSSLLRRLLRSHPDLVVPNETHWIPILHETFGFEPVPCRQIEEIVRSLCTGRGVSILDRICREEGLDSQSFFTEIAHGDDLLTWHEYHNRFGTLLKRKQAALHWGDKTPDYGFCIDTIAEAWPDARFVHLVRDGRDVALSMSHVPSFQQLAAANQVEWKYLARQAPQSYQRHEGLPLASYFDMWLRRIRASTDQLRLLAPHQVLPVRYEDLLTEPSRSLRSIATFLSVAPLDEWLEQAANEVRSNNAAGNKQLEAFQRLSGERADALDWFETQYPRQYA